MDFSILPEPCSFSIPPAGTRLPNAPKVSPTPQPNPQAAPRPQNTEAPEQWDADGVEILNTDPEAAPAATPPAAAPPADPATLANAFQDPKFLEYLKWGVPIGAALGLAGYAVGGSKPGTLLPWLLGGAGGGALLGGLYGHYYGGEGEAQDGEAVTPEEAENAEFALQKEQTEKMQQMYTESGPEIQGNPEIARQIAQSNTEILRREYQNAYNAFNRTYIMPVYRDPNKTPAQKRSEIAMLAEKRDKELIPQLIKLREEQYRAAGHFDTVHDTYNRAYRMAGGDTHPSVATPFAYFASINDAISKFFMPVNTAPSFINGEFKK